VPVPGTAVVGATVPEANVVGVPVTAAVPRTVPGTVPAEVPGTVGAGVPVPGAGVAGGRTGRLVLGGVSPPLPLPCRLRLVLPKASSVSDSSLIARCLRVSSSVLLMRSLSAR
jgi:hypothetical protein